MYRRPPFDLARALARERRRFAAVLMCNSTPALDRLIPIGQGDIYAGAVWLMEDFVGYVLFRGTDNTWGYQVGEAAIVWYHSWPEPWAPDEWGCALCIAEGPPRKAESSLPEMAIGS